MKRAGKWIPSVLLLILALVFLSPIYIMLVNSFKNRAELYTNALALPQSLNFEYYASAIDKMNFFRVLGNSLLVTILTVIFVVILSSMTAWMLVRRDTKISKWIFMAYVATMLIPFQTLMMPLMQVMDWIRTNLHIPMLNTHGGLIYMNIGFHASMAVFCTTDLSNRFRSRWRKPRLWMAARNSACLADRVPDAEDDHDYRGHFGRHRDVERLSAAVADAVG
ncbi:hypothetical protein HMSSN036_26630 [Paenibacillus macerans]|nr:hypothetical protein HMSSN036_26630 [Paenibacillus macerans]